MSAFLYALTVQPLMVLLKQRMREGHLKGNPLDDIGNKQLLFQLFTDDTGMYLDMTEENFQEMREALSQYEQILGAKLNLSKSTLVVMDEHPFSDWLDTT